MLKSIAAALLALASSVVLLTASAWLITSAAFRPPLSELALGITAVRAAGIARAVFRYLERLCTHSAALDSLADIRLRLFKLALEKLPLKSGASMQGEFLHSLTVRADIARDFLPRVVVPIVCAVALTAVSTFILFRSIGTIALLVPTALLASSAIARLVEERTIDESSYRDRLLDFHDGLDELAVADSFDRVRSILDNEAQSSIDTRILNADSIAAILNAAALCITLYFLAARLEMIELAMHLFLLLITFETVSRVPSAVRLIEKIRAAKNFSIEKKIEPSQTRASEKIISIEKIKFGFDERLVLDGLSLEMLRAERIAIVGESGVGKTTLLNLILGLWKPDEGSISIGGSLAAATSTNYIFARSIKENFLSLLPNVSDERIVECLKLVGLETLKLDDEVGVDGAKLSGGQRCRLQTALALAADAELLILDEPTAGLDRKTAERLIEAVLENSKALIVITHDPSVAAKFETVYRLREGRLEREAGLERIGECAIKGSALSCKEKSLSG